MHVKAFYLSNICNATGTCLEQHLSTQFISCYKSLQMAALPKTNPEQMSIMAMGITSHISIRQTADPSHTCGSMVLSMCNVWYFYPEESALYQKSKLGWKHHSIVPHHSHTLSFHRKGHNVETESNENVLQVASVVANGLKLLCTRLSIMDTVEAPASQNWKNKLWSCPAVLF